MNVETKLTIAAQCDRAARDGANEDNCLVLTPVGRPKPTVSHFGDVIAKDLSKMVPLRDKGCLLVVADGMGGMNAGEVASQIAVKTLAGCFSEGGMKNLEMTDNAIRKFIRKAILAADDAIKKTAAQDKEKEGMGTTVVLLWILPDNTAYYAWCGDSRLYRYSPDEGLQALSRDHSYVMEVLHLSEEEAFDHPNNNIITRSLGNPAEKANPEVEGPINIYQDDLFLLCSDGLCGALPSQKIHEDISCIEDVIEESIPDADHLEEGINELWTAAAAAGWHDNVTTVLCQVKKGPARPKIEKKPAAFQTNKSNSSEPPLPSQRTPRREEKRNRKDTLIALLVVLLLSAIVAVVCLLVSNRNGKDDGSEKPVQTEQDAPRQNNNNAQGQGRVVEEVPSEPQKVPAVTRQTNAQTNQGTPSQTASNDGQDASSSASMDASATNRQGGQQTGTSSGNPFRNKNNGGNGAAASGQAPTESAAPSSQTESQIDKAHENMNSGNPQSTKSSEQTGG